MWGSKNQEPSPETESGKKKSPGDWRAKWGVVLGYLLLSLGMLWFWQETIPSMAFRTIPYSEFKQRMAKGEIVECTIAADEIDGKIDTGHPAVRSDHSDVPEHAVSDKAPAAKKRHSLMS